MSENQSVTHVVLPTKSMAVAILLAIFFGPLGLFYSSVTGAIIMTIITIPVALITAGIGLVVLIPICILIAAVAVNKHNAKLTGVA